MKQTKEQIRKQLAAGVAVFLSSGKQITKVDSVKPRQKRTEPKEKIVEIEVDFLPKALQQKYFAE